MSRFQHPKEEKAPATLNSISPPSAQASLVERVAARARVQLPVTIAELAQYIRIPAISCEPAHASDVKRLASVVRERLMGMGFEAEVRELSDALPLVSAVRRCQNPSAPTILIYGHLDLQPVKGERWVTPPHEAVRKKNDPLAFEDMESGIEKVLAVQIIDKDLLPIVTSCPDMVQGTRILDSRSSWHREPLWRLRAS